jgi:asparagine synthase (glutamine-hydrolysing)
MVSASGTVIVFNGEIFNFQEIKARHFADVPFKSTGDTEVLLRAYARWGSNMLRKLDGIFAFALFDARRRRLIVARDHGHVSELVTATLVQVPGVRRIHAGLAVDVLKNQPDWVPFDD